MLPKAFVYTEIQISVPFENVPWVRINEAIKTQPGFMNKTWLSGLNSQSAGGFYAFDSIENAQKFVKNYFPKEAASFGVAQTTAIFDAEATQEASIDMNSVHFGGRIQTLPKAFVYTEVQVSVPTFDEAPWKQLNPEFRNQPGLLCKTWTYGLHTKSVGGFYGFDSLDNAKKFAIEYMPTVTGQLNAAYNAKIFDAEVTEAASRQMNSPFYI